MESTQSYRFFNRGPSTVARLVFFGVISLLLLFIDARFKTFESVRVVLQVVVYPIQRITTLPNMAWHGISEYLVTQKNLLKENSRLSQQHNVDAIQLQQAQAMQLENQQLRKLLEVRQRVNYPMQVSEIAYIDQDFFKRKVIVDKGLAANIQAGQIVMDDIGIIGQITHVYPLSSEVTLITNKDHAVPVQVLRSGLRAVVFGSGNISELTLRYMPMNADIVVGDQLVTSGIDGTYPAGIPVAKIIKVERDPAYPFARILAVPLAGVDKNHFLLIASSLPLIERPSTEPAEEKSSRRSRREQAR
jgi:rod shape-determining protein MreC